MSGKHNKNKIFSIIILFMLFVSSVFISIQTVDFADAGSVWTVESDSDFNNGTLHETEIVGLVPSGSPPLGLAIDLGTTKIAASLVDLTNGNELAVAGALNGLS